jgi:cellulose 1,4-beta-cellobiosidase
MDIWEANQFAEAVTPHPCSSTGLARTDCTSGSACSAGGICDPAGCDFNSWRMGNQTFLGPGSGFTIDTTKPIQVVTQFISSDGTANGDLVEIRRKFVQNGKVFDNSYSNIPGLTPYNSITDATCQAQKTAFSDTNYFSQAGGIKQMGAAFKRGMVLVLSIWDDTSVSMLWLGQSAPARFAWTSLILLPDSDYPTTADASQPGVNRGPCSTSSGKPADIEKSQASAKVIYSDIRWGDIGSTYTGTPVGASPPGGGTTTTGSTTSTGHTTTPTTTKTSTTPSSSPTGCTVSHYGQCGGQGMTCCFNATSALTLIRLYRLHDLRLWVNLQVLESV